MYQLLRITKWKLSSVLPSGAKWLVTQLSRGVVGSGGKDNISYEKFVDGYRRVMARVPQPVVVVTTALSTGNESNDDDGVIKRGVTCSSFTSVSLNPPIISFAMNRPSRMHDLLLKSGRFAVHVLGQEQMDYGIHFSQPVQEGHDQFDNIPHKINEQGIPVIDSTMAVLHCTTHSVHQVGDHDVWYGEVCSCARDTQYEPLIYFARSYRSVSDELLMRAFESRELPFEEWTHHAHLRMAWNYIQEYGLDAATPLIRIGIRRYNEKNRDKIDRGYHETVTMLFIHLVHHAIQNNPHSTFDELLAQNPDLSDSRILFAYYSPEMLNTPTARKEFVQPDKRSLPGVI